MVAFTALVYRARCPAGLGIVRQPDVRDRILSGGSEPVGNTPEVFRKYLLRDLDKWTRLVKQSGAKLD